MRPKKLGVSLFDLEKAMKNRSKLVAVKRAVKRKDGKTFQQTFYVSPEEAKEMMSGKHTQVKEESKSYSVTLGTGKPMDKEQAKQAVTELKNKLGVEGVIKFALANGVEWTRNEKHVGNDYMQLAMKLTKHLREGKQFTSGKTQKEQEEKPKQEEKPTNQNLSKLHQFFNAINLPFTEQADGTIIIGNRYGTVKNPWGKQDTAPGHIRVVEITKKPKFGDKFFIKLDSAYLDKDNLKDSLNARWDTDDKKWFVPLEVFTGIFKQFSNVEITPQVNGQLKQVFANDKVTIDKLKDAFDSFPSRNGIGQNTTQQQEEEFDITQFKNPSGMKNPWGSEPLNLYNHQKTTVNFLLKNKKATAGLAVGLGKTLCAITGVKQLISDKKIKRAIVIAPSSVKYNWKNEIEAYSDMKATVLESSKLGSDDVWKEAEKSDVIIINYEMLRKPEIAEKLNELAPNCIIADEAHKLKNAKAQQTKGFNKHWENSTYKWFLSATPFPNGQPEEVYTILRHLRPDVVGSWSSFSRQYVVFSGSGRWVKAVSLKNVKQLEEKMKNVVIIRTHKSPDVNSSLPSARHVSIRLEMNKEQQKIYNAISDEIMDQLVEMEQGGMKVSQLAIIAKLKRLEQVAIDPDMLQDDSSKIDMNKLYPKEQYAVDTITDILEDTTNRGIVLFCDMKLPLQKVAQGLKNNGVDVNKIAYITGDVKPEERTKIQERFKTGEVQVVLCTSAGEEGVNLQHGGHTLLHLDVPWVPKSITQREGRVLRQGQTSDHTVFFTPIMGGTVEDKKRAKLGIKIGTIEKLLGTGSAGSSAQNVAGDENPADKLSWEDFKNILGR